MAIVNISELQKFLKQHGIFAKKSLSQNFLIDGNIINKILSAADIQEGDRVVEIGPGPGALTEQLLKRKATVFAIEKDSFFCSELSRFQTPDQRLHIFEEDALKFNFEDIAYASAASRL